MVQFLTKYDSVCASRPTKHCDSFFFKELPFHHIWKLLFAAEGENLVKKRVKSILLMLGEYTPPLFS